MENPFGKTEDETPKEEVAQEEPEKQEEIPVVPVEEPKVKKSRKQSILESYGGKESDIPINSPYWKL